MIPRLAFRPWVSDILIRRPESTSSGPAPWQAQEEGGVGYILRATAITSVLLSAVILFQPFQAKSQEKRSTNERVLEVWNLFDEGELDEAQALAEDIRDAEGDSLLVLTALLGFIYEEKGRYGEALGRLDVVRPTLRKALTENRTADGAVPLPEHTRRSYLRLYVGVLRASGFAHYRTGNCRAAVPELQELMGTVKAPNPFALSIIGSCLYQEKEFEAARKHFEESHRLYGEGPLKDEAAYNVGAMYALEGVADKSVEWLWTASKNDRGRWLEAVSSDLDFDGIRESDAFRKFLEGIEPP